MLFDWADHFANLIENDDNTGLAMAVIRAGMKPGPATRMLQGAIKTFVPNTEPERETAPHQRRESPSRERLPQAQY